MVRDKRGWFRVFEASVACLILLAVFLFVFIENKGLGDGEEQLKSKIIQTLEEINLNESLRSDILSENPGAIEVYLNESIGSLFEYKFLICDLGADCDFESSDDGLLVVSRIYAAEGSEYLPRELKIGLF